MAKVESDQRMRKLAALAATLINQPVHEQFAVLRRAGLKLTDINWENCNEPGMADLVTVRLCTTPHNVTGGKAEPKAE